MTAAQGALFAETMILDESSLQARLAELQRGLPETPKTAKGPRRQALPERLSRVEHCNEPEHTSCPNPQCGQPMQRIGKDASERLDITPAQFFLHGASATSGPASVAKNCARSLPSRTWSRAARPPADWRRTR